MPLSANAQIWTERRFPEIGRHSLPVIGSRINTYFYIDTRPGASEIRTGSVFRKMSTRLPFKSHVKSQMKELKKKRGTPMTAHDHKQLKAVRRQMHELRRALRKGGCRCQVEALEGRDSLRRPLTRRSS